MAGEDDGLVGLVNIEEIGGVAVVGDVAARRCSSEGEPLNAAPDCGGGGVRRSNSMAAD